MDVVSTCPLPVASVLWQPRAGKWALTFVCKATYRLVPGESELASEQEPPNEYDNFWDDDATRSLYAPSDLAPFKARADVILVGNAFAPRREPTRSLIAQLMVGQMTKSIECHCDRMWTVDGQLREGPKFTKIALRYERAGGGPDTTNPVGMRPDAADAYGMVYLPNLQEPADPVPQRGEVVAPIGFGPIAPAWPSRAQRLGRHAATWFEGPWNSRPLPEDIEPTFFNCAPLDQQVDAIRAGERILLENLHPEHARLVTNLPGAAPRAVLERPGAAPEAVNLMCDTLWIDTDRSLCTLVYRGRVALDHRAQPGRVVVSLEAPASPRSAPVEPPRLAWSKEPPPKPPALGADARDVTIAMPHIEEDVTHVTHPLDPAQDGVLPFVGGAPGGGVAPSGVAPSGVAPSGVAPGGVAMGGVASAPAGGSPAAADDDDDDPWRDTTAAMNVNPARGASLPFSGGADPKSPTLPFQPRPTLPAQVVKSTSTAAGPRPTLVGMASPTPPAMPAPPVPPAPPPIVRPPPPVDPAPPAAAPSPWATGKAPGYSSQPPLPARAPAPPVPSEPAQKGATFLPKFDPKFDAPAPAVPSAAAAAAAATSGAAAASNVAAMGARSAASPAPAARAAEQPAARPGGREILTLLWFDPTFIKPISDHKRWAEILEQPDDDDDPPKRDISPGDDAGDDADDDASEDADDPDMYVRDEIDDDQPEEDVPQEVIDRRNVFKILARGEPMTAGAIDQEVADAIRKDGTLEPPLVLLAGDLVFPFDELETLKATVTAVSPLVAGDKKLKEVVDTVNELLKTPWLSRSGAVAEGQTARIKEAFSQGTRMVPASYLQEHTDRILLEERHYQKRTVFGQTWIRSLYVSASAPDQIPAYLPESLTKQLPMFQRLRVRVIAEVHMQQDQYESHPIALRVVALARVSVLAPRSGGGGGKPS